MMQEAGAEDEVDLAIGEEGEDEVEAEDAEEDEGFDKN